MIRSIRDLDEETWRKFTAFCKLKGIKVGDELNEVLNKFLKKNFRI